MDSILITGGNGFIGKSLTEYLLKETDLEIVSMHRTDSVDSAMISDRVRTVYQDLSNPIQESVANEIGDVKYIVHLAGTSDFRDENPSRFLINNLTGTLNLMEYSKHSTSVEKVLYLSTAEVFGSSNPGHVFKEDDIKSPSSIYATTKLGAESICRLYKEFYNVPVVTAYAMNTFGPFQSPHKFIPLLIEKIRNEEEVHIYMDQDGVNPSRRNYLYIDDFCDAMWFLLTHGSSGERYNIASEIEVDNLELAHMISTLLDMRLRYRLVERVPDSPLLPKLSGKKLFNMGWSQKTRLKDGLEKIINHTVEEK